MGTGVPQGSVLGPLLFAIIINDLAPILESSKYAIFADDLQRYYSFPPSELAEGIQEITKNCNAIAKWAAENGLTLNVDKCKAMILGSLIFTSRLDLETIPKITISGNALPCELNVKSLGVWLDLNLKWKKHVGSILQKIYGSLRTLKFHSRALSRDLRKSLIETMVLPHFDYACAVYDSVDKTRNLKLYRALNACVRFVYGNIGTCEHVTPHHLELKWLSVESRRKYFIGNLAYSIITYQPRSLYYKNLRTGAQGDSFVVTASKLLDRYSPIIFRSRLINTFKKFLFQQLLEDDAEDWARQLIIDAS